MKLFFESYSIEDFDELVTEFSNILEDCAIKGFELSDIQSAFEKAVSEKEDYFFEAVIKGKEVDLRTKTHTISHALQNPDNESKMNQILTDATYRKVPFSKSKQDMIDLVNSFENVSDEQKRECVNIISKSSNPNHLTSIMTTYWMGDVVDRDRKAKRERDNR